MKYSMLLYLVEIQRLQLFACLLEKFIAYCCKHFNQEVTMSYHNKAYGFSRLKSKNARDAIIQHISEDFNPAHNLCAGHISIRSLLTFNSMLISILSPVKSATKLSLNPNPSTGSVWTGKHIALAKKVSCKLTLNDPLTDYEILAQYGLAGLRRHRLLRLTREALNQSAVLSYEDLAVILTIPTSRDYYQT